MNEKPQFTFEECVEKHMKIIQEKLLPKGPLTDFNVAVMRNAAPTHQQLSILNAALARLGWKR